MPTDTDCPSKGNTRHRILSCLAEGLSDKQIAARLDLSLSNVDYHMRQLRLSFGARNRVQLLRFAQESSGGIASA
jgi:DNA-binding NarL/FixJ family response regulator